MAEGIRPTERITPREPTRLQPVREQPNLPRKRHQSPPRSQPQEETPPDEQPHQLDVEV